MTDETEYSDGLRKGLTPNVMKLGLVSFVADIASEMLYPIVPIFLSATLGAPATAIGFIEGLAELIASLLKVFSGRWSDRTRQRKVWIIGGYFASAMGKTALGFAASWFWVLLCRAMDRVGKGFRTSPRDALLSDSVRPQFQGKAFGWHRGMDTLGAALGPLVALLLINTTGDLRSVFFYASIPAFLTVLAVFWVREIPGDTKAATTTFQFSELPKPFWKFLIVVILFSLTNSSDAFLILRFQGHEKSMSSLIWTYCGFNLVYAITSPWFGSLADRIGFRRSYFLGYFLFAITYGIFAMTTEKSLLVGAFLIYGIYMAMTEGISKALAISLVPSHLKGTAIGLLGLSLGISSLIASTLAGALWDRISPSSVFYLGMAGALLAAVLFSFLLRTSHHSR